MAAIWCRQLGHRRKEDAHKVQKHECKGCFPKIYICFPMILLSSNVSHLYLTQTCFFSFPESVNMFFGIIQQQKSIRSTAAILCLHQHQRRWSVSPPAPHSQPNTIWSSYGSETSYSSWMICSAPVIAAHHLPAGLGGQRSRPTVDVQLQRWTGIRRRAGEGELSSLADAPVLCRAVRGDEVSRRRRRRRSEWVTWNHWKQTAEIEICEPNNGFSRKGAVWPQHYLDIDHEYQCLGKGWIFSKCKLLQSTFLYVFVLFF